MDEALLPVYRNNPELGPVLGLLAVWLALFSSEAAISPRWPRYVPISQQRGAWIAPRGAVAAQLRHAE
jgi:hypothetical protein